MQIVRYARCKKYTMQFAKATAFTLLPHGGDDAPFFIGVNNLRDQARAALTGEERD